MIPSNLVQRYHILTQAPKVFRTHCWVQVPGLYDIVCPVSPKHKTTWSEFEKHIWCYACEVDWFVPLYHSGIFSGPIPLEVSRMFGIRLDRVNVATGEILHHDLYTSLGKPFDIEYQKKLDKKFSDTWVRNEELEKWCDEHEDECNKIAIRLDDTETTSN